MKLEVKNGSFSYGTHKVLDNINMTVCEHDVYAVLGRNGAGKTTLLRCIMRMLRWESGGALLDGRSMEHIPDRQLWRSVAYVPQAKRGKDISVRDMIVMGRSAHIGMLEKPDEHDYEIADAVIDRLYIQKLAEKSCCCLSGGELQLVLIGRALAAEPRLLIMDEPESNLDYHNQLHVLGIISEISKTSSCILNTHYPEHALRYANKALLLWPDGTGLAGKTENVITEGSLRKAFGIDVHIGETVVGEEQYKYIIPLHGR